MTRKEENLKFLEMMDGLCDQFVETMDREDAAVIAGVPLVDISKSLAALTDAAERIADVLEAEWMVKHG